MKAFGREVASRTIANILAGVVLAALGAAYTLAPVVSTRFGITFREVFAWLTATIALIALAFALWLLRRKPAPPSPAKPASLALTLNNGVKPTVTLTNHGGATKYRADGRIISHVDGTQSSHPTQFRCQLQVGREGGWDVVLQDGEWAHIILGSLEDVLPASKGLTAVESWTPVGKMLVIRRGKMGEHVRVPDTGALVELTIKATPPLAEPLGPRLFRVVRIGDVATVTHA